MSIALHNRLFQEYEACTADGRNEAFVRRDLVGLKTLVEHWQAALAAAVEGDQEATFNALKAAFQAAELCDKMGGRPPKGKEIVPPETRGVVRASQIQG